MLRRGEDSTMPQQPVVPDVDPRALPVSSVGRKEPLTPADVSSAETAMRGRANLTALRHGQLLALCARRHIGFTSQTGAQLAKNDLISKLNQWVRIRLALCAWR